MRLCGRWRECGARFPLTCEARCESSQFPRQVIQSKTGIQLQWPHVHFKDRSPAFNIRRPCVGKTGAEEEEEEGGGECERKEWRGKKRGREFYTTQMKMMRSICSEAHKSPSVYKTPPGIADGLSLPPALCLSSLMRSPSVFHVRNWNVPLGQLG